MFQSDKLHNFIGIPNIVLVLSYDLILYFEGKSSSIFMLSGDCHKLNIDTTELPKRIKGAAVTSL